MKIKWRFLSFYLLLTALVILLFWLGESARYGIIHVDPHVVFLAIALPGIVMLLLISAFAKRLGKILDSARNLVKGHYEKVHYADSTDELGEIASELYRLGRQMESIFHEATREAQKMEAILTGMQEGVISVDHVGRIVLLNRAAELIFGRTQEEVKHEYLIQLVMHNDLDRLVNDVLAGGSRDSLEIMLGARVVRMEVSPVRTVHNHPGGAVVVCYDVTELRRLEQVRTEFVANVSHELRTPLTSIIGFVETLMDGAVEDPVISQRFLRIIQAEASRLHRLVDDLLEISRLEDHEHRRVEARLHEAYVQEVFVKIEPVIRRHAEAKQLTLDIQLSENLPAVSIGEDLLSQLMFNLLENAIKYTQAGRVWLKGTYELEMIRLEFGDTGCGIPEESLPRIFERFYRVDKARSRNQGGTGLGLSIVKHIIEGCGGKIRVKSRMNEGTVFVCELPPYNALIFPPAQNETI